jgi:dTDP-4-amino-4,6-dideoxygalactose transaminase
VIRLFDNEAQLAPLRGEIAARVADVLEHRRFIFGPEVKAFEHELADYLGVRHVVGVANGTDAITIAVRALGVKPGDEVVVPSFTFYATAEAVATAGATPVFCDVDPGTRNVTPDTVRAALTPRAAAIVAVDLFGSPAPVPELRELGLPVLEDAAQAAGSSLGGVHAGALGDVATLSFYPSKNLPCFGDGGAVMTDDDEIAEQVRTLRFHGSRDKETFTEVGYNSRLDELQAAVLRVMLAHLDAWSDGRRAAADGYAAAGLGEHVMLPRLLEGALAAWHLYVVAHPRADELIAQLGQHGIEARSYYRIPTHRQPAMAGYPSAELAGTDEIARTNLALPMGPSLQSAEIEEVVACIARAARA